jgi:hypothetical protein
MLRNLFIYCCVAICCVFLTYAIWVVVAMNRTATISVDYVALLNEKAVAVPKGMRAWPLYRDAAIALGKNPEPTNVFYEEDIETPTWPTQDGWVHYKKWILEHTDTIDLILEASQREGLGYILNGTVADEDKELWPEEYESQQNQSLPDGFLDSVLLPQLGPMRGNARLLAMDAKDAAANLDSGRCLVDVLALLAVGTHIREHPLVISDLVSLSIYNMAFSTIEEILERHPTLLTNEELEILVVKLQELDDYLTVRFDGERMFVLDILQRMYTDDGNGDGKIIPMKSSELLIDLGVVSPTKTNSSLLPALIAPIADIYQASRKEMLEEYDRRLRYFENMRDTSQYTPPIKSEFAGAPWVQTPSVLDPFYIVELLTPAFDNAIDHAEHTLQRRDALLVNINALPKSE